MSGSRGTSTGSRAAAGTIVGGLRRWWSDRPVRPRRGGKVSGVSAGIGLRYGIDPIIVRIGFVVVTLYGSAGIGLYSLCWLIFPKSDGQGGSQPTRWPVALVLVLALVPATFMAFNKYAFAGLVLGLGGFYLLHRHCHDRGTRLIPATPVSENTWVYPGEAQAWVAPEGADPETSAAHADADPATADPADIDDTESAESGSDQRNRRWISYASIGLALIAAGAAVFDGAAAVTALAVSLGVLGAGMVVASFAGGGRGLLWLAIPLAALTIMVNALPTNAVWRAPGRLMVRPNDTAAVLPRYDLNTGDITLDLTSLRLGNDQQVRSSVFVGDGSVIVRVPPDADLIASCSAEQGWLRCADAKTGQRLTQRVDEWGVDGPGGGQIHLDLKVGDGSVEVARG